MTKTERAKAEALKLRAEGTPIEVIIAKTGLEPQEVVDAIAEGEQEVETLQGIRQEAALIGFGVTKQERLKRLVALRDKVEGEIDKRDFSDIPTEKLPAMLLKINEAIREEVTPPRIISTPMFDNWEAGDRRTIANL